MLAGIESRPAPSPRIDRFRELGRKTKTRRNLLHLICLGPKMNIPNLFIHLISHLHRINYVFAVA